MRFLPDFLWASVFLMILVSGAFAQSSPDVTALNRYGETPVGLYAGQPQINVPLGGISGQNLAVNFAATYSPGGVKVEEYGSWLGLSWNIQGGGAITRAIQGVNDFNPGGHLKKPIPSFASLDENCENSSSCTEAEAILDEAQDSQPDIFYYNFAGHSGKFVFNNKGQVELLSVGALKIQPPTTEDGEWIIILPNGVSYTFGSTGFLEKSDNHVIGWYLKKITSALGEEAVFSYQPFTYTYQLPALIL